LNVLDITIIITTETLLINNIKENVSELPEVKFIKKFLHAVCQNCHGKNWLKLNVYINHKGNVHGKQSLMIIIPSLSSCVQLC